MLDEQKLHKNFSNDCKEAEKNEKIHTAQTKAFIKLGFLDVDDMLSKCLTKPDDIKDVFCEMFNNIIKDIETEINPVVAKRDVLGYTDDDIKSFIININNNHYNNYNNGDGYTIQNTQ